MKKLMLTLAALALAVAVAAQDREIDLERIEEFNKLELNKNASRVKVKLSTVTPMYFGWSVLTDVNYKGVWAVPGMAGCLDTRTGKNFVYGLELAALHFKPSGSPLDVSLGLRWTFMDFAFSRPDYTLRQSALGYVFVPIAEETPSYNYDKSKIHANYFGIPLRVALHYGHATVYAGASAELCTGGYAKYKRPKSRTQIGEVFNPVRATVEGGFSYGLLGVYVQYGLTPLFRESLSDARTLTFGLVLGL